MVVATQVRFIHFGIDVPVGEDQIGPTVIIEVEEHGSPAEVLRMQAEPRSKCNVGKNSISTVLVKDGSVIGKVRFKNVQAAVAVVIGDSGTHTGLLASVFIKRHACHYRNVGERAVAIVVVQNAGDAIAGNIDVWPAVIVEIKGRDAERVVSVGFVDVCLGGDVGKLPVT